jgi:hypothetical protein
MRWRLIGAWRWPLFLVVTVADAVIITELPPTGTSALFFPALFICSFANLFLIGAVAPWLARRIVARQGAAAGVPSTFPPANHLELLVDRIACAILVLAAIGLIAAGLGNKRVVVAATDRVERGADAARGYVNAHAPPEIVRNFDTLNTHPTDEDGFFRMCVAYDERTRAWCMFVDAKPQPPVVRRDPDTRPNGLYFGN